MTTTTANHDSNSTAGNAPGLRHGDLFRGLGDENNPAPNSCAMCKHEMTCGYSGTDDKTGKRDSMWAYRSCILGLMSNGETFFTPKPSSPNHAFP